MLGHVLLKLFYFVYFLAFSLLLGDLLLSDTGKVLKLVSAGLASASAIAEVAIFEALAVAVEAVLAIVATGLGIGTLCLGCVAIEELLKQLFSQLLILACSSTFLGGLSLRLFG